jgi:hypothetical protein
MNRKFIPLSPCPLKGVLKEKNRRVEFLRPG